MGILAGGACILYEGADFLHSLETLNNVLEEINKTNAEIAALENNCPTDPAARAAIQAEIQGLRLKGAGLATQKGAIGLRLSGVFAVGLVVCPAIAAFF